MSEQMEANVADICHVINSAVVLSLVLNAENSEHVHHASHSLLYRHYLEEIFLDVYVALEVLPQLQAFSACLQLQASAKVPISTCHKHEVAFFEQGEGFQPDVEFHQGTLDVNAIRYSFLRYSSQFSAEITELRIVLRHYVVVKRPNFLERLRINHDHWKLDDFWARLNLLVFDASGLKVKDKQVVEFYILKVCPFFLRDILLYLLLFAFLRLVLPFFLLEVVLDLVDLFLWKGSPMIFDEFNAYCADIEHIINATMMLSFVFQSQSLEHLHHARHPVIRLHHDVIILLDVNVGMQEGLDCQLFVFGLSLQAVCQIPVSARDKSIIVVLYVRQFQEPFFHMKQHFLNGETVLHHLLGYSSQLGAKFGQYRIEPRLHILMKLIQYFSGVGMDDYNRKLNDFWAGFHLLVLDAGGLKVQHQQVFYLGVLLHRFILLLSRRDNRALLYSQLLEDTKDQQSYISFGFYQKVNGLILQFVSCVWFESSLTKLINFRQTYKLFQTPVTVVIRLQSSFPIALVLPDAQITLLFEFYAIIL